MNRFIASEKRILTKKLYILSIILLVVLTTIYKLLPEKSKSTDIRVAIFLEDDSEYAKQLVEELNTASSLYQFYYTDNEKDATFDVQSGYAECGFMIPSDFFNTYIAGTGEHKVTLLETPSTTLSAPICETLFHYIFKITSPAILLNCVQDDHLNEELLQRMDAYINGETIFQMQSLTDRKFNYKNIIYHIELPIYEFSCLLLIFAGLFGLLLYLRDREKNIYIALSNKEQFGILCSVLSASILPMLVTGIVCSFLAYRTSKLLAVLLVSSIAFILPILLSIVIKKSSSIAKIMPILLFCSILYFFIGYIL